MESFLDLEDRELTADFILAAADYLPAKARKDYEDLDVPIEKLAGMAKQIAEETWAPKRALDQFLKTIGQELEWEAVTTNVRPATALLLKRLRKNADAKSLDETLNAPDASYAIQSDQEIEIDMVRDEARVDLFESHKEALEPMIEEAQTEFDAIKKRLKKIREQAFEMKGAAQDTLVARLDALEDNIYFGGEAPSLEVLDAELKFDQEEAALPAE